MSVQVPSEYPSAIIFTKSNGELRVVQATEMKFVTTTYIQVATPYEKHNFTNIRLPSIKKVVPMKNLLVLSSVVQNSGAETGRCKAITKKGTQCSRRGRVDCNGFCKQHKNYTVVSAGTPESSTQQCKALTKSGTQCSRTAKQDGYCKQHFKIMCSQSVLPPKVVPIVPESKNQQASVNPFMEQQTLPQQALFFPPSVPVSPPHPPRVKPEGKRVKRNLAKEYAQQVQSEIGGPTFAVITEEMKTSAKRMMTPFNRIGSKKKLLKMGLLKMFPPHKLYVEPFVGGGSVFFSKKPSEYSVVNDLDENMYRLFYLLKTSQLPFTCPDISTLAKKQKLVDEKAPEHEFVWRLLLNKCTFNSTGKGKLCDRLKPSSFKYILSLLPYFQNKLRMTEIENKDWEQIVKEYDTKDTFFYLDPPYEGQNFYSSATINFVHMSSVLKNIKGKFLLSLNDTESIRKAFEGFRMLRTKPIKYKMSKKDMSELLICNYDALPSESTYV